MTPAVRTGVLVLAIAWGAIFTVLHMIEPTRPLAPASSSPNPDRVELDANFAAQSARPSSAPGWAAPTDNNNSKGKTP